MPDALNPPPDTSTLLLSERICDERILPSRDCAQWRVHAKGSCKAHHVSKPHVPHVRTIMQRRTQKSTNRGCQKAVPEPTKARSRVNCPMTSVPTQHPCPRFVLHDPYSYKHQSQYTTRNNSPLNYSKWDGGGVPPRPMKPIINPDKQPHNNMHIPPNPRPKSPPQPQTSQT